MEELFHRFASAVAIGVEAAAALFIAIGAIEALFLVVRRYTPSGRASVLSRKEIWVRFAVWLLLALEFELAADVLQTAISPTWDDVGKLAAIAAHPDRPELLSGTRHREVHQGQRVTGMRARCARPFPNHETRGKQTMVSVVLRSAVARSSMWMAAAAFALLSGAVPAAAQDPAAPAPPRSGRRDRYRQARRALRRLGRRADEDGRRRGRKIDASYTQFFDWVPDGDDDRGFDYGGKFDVKVQSSLSKLPVGGLLRHRSLRGALR